MGKFEKNEIKNKDGNIEKYLPSKKLGIFRKFLISFLLISILPLLLFGLYSYSSISRVGKTSIQRVKETIDEKTKETLIMQAVQAAGEIRSFLENREIDLNELLQRPATPKSYLDFSRFHSSLIWLPDGHGLKSPGIKKRIPLYKELSFVLPDGNELFKIRENKIVPKSRLKNVANPLNTTYKSEKYFSEAIKLSPGEVYVSHLNGFFVTPEEEFKEKGDKELLKISKYYDGVIRFAAPKFVGGRLAGIVVLGVDHRHLMEFTQHLLPNSGEKIVFPDYNTGDYAFLFDDEGWIITHPKFWDIRGNFKNGKPVPAYSVHTPQKLIEQGYIPFNLDSAGFIHPNYPLVANEVRKLNSGSVITKNVGGVVKVMAYAPVLYNKGVYKKYGIFGGVTIGSEIHRFRGAADIAARELSGKIEAFRDDLIGFTAATFLIVLVVVWFFSKSFSNPIQQLTEAVKKFADGDLSTSIDISRDDELGVLSNSFNLMAYEIKRNREELLNSLKELERSKENAVRYAKDLEYQLKIISAIQEISSLLGHTFNVNFIIREILKSSVNAIGFDRSILYLLDDSGKYLECKDIYGFTEEEEKFARSSKFNVNRHDCIETKVLKTGRIVFVKNFSRYKKATEIDKKINRISKSNSFVYVPLKIKEKTIGILGADKLRTRGKITRNEINSLQVFANQVSRVIENAKLYQEIIRQRNFVNDIFNNMLNGVITTDGEGKITSINAPAKEILEIKGNPLHSSIYKIFPQYSDLFENINDEIRNKGVYRSYNQKFVINGKVKYLNLIVSEIKGAETTKSIPVVAIIQDQTERKALEDHIRKVDRLVSLGRFAAAIAHEIRNPLTGLSLFLDDIHDKISADANMREIISQALEEIERLENLVNEILDFATPSVKEIRKVNLRDLIISTINFVDKHAEKSNIQIELELSEDIPEIDADGSKIRQALLNILLNAIQFQPNGGRIFIKSFSEESIIGITLKNKKSRWAVITIEDAGPGVPDEKKSEIFEPFFSEYPEGTGLGLAIVHSIITEHNGFVFVDDSELGGAKFSLYLPFQK